MTTDDATTRVRSRIRARSLGRADSRASNVDALADV